MNCITIEQRRYLNMMEISIVIFEHVKNIPVFNVQGMNN